DAMTPLLELSDVTIMTPTGRPLFDGMSLRLGRERVPGEPAACVLALRDVSARAGERALFASLDLAVRRQRVAVVGPNGAGKTTLLEIMLGRRAPEAGSASHDLSRIGSI